MAFTEERCTLNMEHLEKRAVDYTSNRPEKLDILG